jgi:hypothetical protein
MAKRSTPTQSANGGIKLVFAELAPHETAPEVALYALDDQGKPKQKLAQARDGLLPVAASNLKGRIALGPDVANLSELSGDLLAVYRADQVAKIWSREGLILPRARWTVFWPLYRCVSGRVRKCRPWWWEIVAEVPIIASAGIKLSKSIALRTQAASQIAIASSLGGIRCFPWRCVPLCDGIVEIYERQCCCIWVDIPDLLKRLREILERIPFPWPPEPDPGPDPAPFEVGLQRLRNRPLQPRLAAKSAAGAVARGLNPTTVPPERLYQAYSDLQRLPNAEAQKYALELDWLYPHFCACSSRKVGETAIQPGGVFDFCYRAGLPPFGCRLSYAYRVRQLIGGSWVTVYDGIASGAWFGAGEEADIRVTNPRALPCGDPGDAPPGEGTPFVMLEHVTGPTTHHFNFAPQTGLSQVPVLDPDDGLYTTGYAPDCPWGGGLGLRLWLSPELNGTVAYYRLSVVPVDSTGTPTGPAEVLRDPVSWTYFDLVGGQWIVQGTGLGPVTQGGESYLYSVPYWSGAGSRNWLSGQYHQIWNTPAFANGRYHLILEVFDATGARIKPNGAVGPGAGKAFQLRRWSSDTVTANVPFADCTHLLWIDNIPVVGDIVDLRQNGVANPAQCQFMTGGEGDQFSIGYRAYHPNGVSNSDSFMYTHWIRWQRGLNGPLGYLAPAISPSTDAGEGGPAAQSGSESFGWMLHAPPSPQNKCTFSVQLYVAAKHWNGASRLSGYDYSETASFALDLGP